MYEQFKSPSDARPTADPRITEAGEPHFERVKPLFDVVPIDRAEVTVQFQSREGSQIAVAIDEKFSVGEIVFLGESMQKRSSWIDALPSRECNIEMSFVPVYIAARIQD